MEFSERLQSELKAQRQSRARTQARIEREIEAGIASYQDWCLSQQKAGKQPVHIVAEGDSWFRYPVGLAVISQLERILDTRILNLAAPGDEVSEMISGSQKKRLERVLEKGPLRSTPFDFFLLSGGGNDLVGQDRFYKWFHDYEEGMTATEIVNDGTFGSALNIVEVNYRIAIHIRDRKSPGTHLLVHGYDHAIPDGRGVCGFGPWLEPGLEHRNVPPRLRRDVVKIFLRRFNDLLEGVASSANGVSVVPTQGTLSDEQWANELHPDNPGFRQVAEVFAYSIRAIAGER